MKKELKGVKAEPVIIRRDFRYTNGGCNLSFSLRIDIKQELKEFIEILKTAQIDVEKQLVEISKK